VLTIILIPFVRVFVLKKPLVARPYKNSKQAEKKSKRNKNGIKATLPKKIYRIEDAEEGAKKRRNL